jgi:putative PIN family toxin of toxin-antitoxin system
MVACDHLLAEVDRALQGRYFATRLTDDERASVSALLRAITVILPDPVSPPRVVRDPGDDYLVALATQASAEAIVTGDKDLLEHEGLEPVAITAREACERLGLK